jgi:acetoacetyl-CoA synthetase
MITAQFFPQGEMNFAEGCLQKRGKQPAIFSREEHAKDLVLTWDDLHSQVSSLVAALRADGIRKGDRICAAVSNVSETVICMLAAGAIGAIWSSVSPDFGEEGVLERFTQIQPKVFFYSAHYFNQNKR